MSHPGSTPRPEPTAPEVSGDPRDFAVNPEEVNARDNYSLHMVFSQVGGIKPEKVAQTAAQIRQAVQETGVEIRGWYDCSGFNPSASLMVWVLGDAVEKCQAAFRVLRDWNKSLVVDSSQEDGEEDPLYFVPVWSAMSRHIPAEFNAAHLPACFGGWVPRKYMAVYPFVRSLDWYTLHPRKRGSILREHGLNGRAYNDVAVSTLTAFALGDWEWTISLEADRLERVMGVLRQQRDAEARLYVKVDTPFYTGVRVELEEYLATLPAGIVWK